jgi:dienelactone hydrolase
MKHFYFLALILPLTLESLAQDCDSVTIGSITNPGPYAVEMMLESDGLRDGPDYEGATLYYPTDATPPYAGMVIVPGYFASETSVEEWGPFYASHGIVTMTIGTNNLGDLPEDRAHALLDAIVTLRQEHSRVTSPLHGALDTTRFAVSGWSMGGGGAQLAAAMDPTLRAVVALCPWLNTNQLMESDLDHPVPVLIFSGQSDQVAPPEIHADVHYSYTPETTDKLLYEVANGNHSIANKPQNASGDIGRIALSWLNTYLLDDVCYCPLFVEEPGTASMYLTTVECEETTAITELHPADDFSIQLYPNPAHDLITIKGAATQSMQYEIFTLLGEQVTSGRIHSNHETVDLSELNSNMYVLRIGRRSYRVFKE